MSANTAVPTATPSQSALRQRFGSGRTPMVIARLVGRDAAFKQKPITARSYIGFSLIGGVLHMVQFNTYNKQDGNGEGLGKNFTPRFTPVDMNEPKKIQRSMKGYHPVDVNSFDLVTAQTGDEGAEANKLVDGIIAWQPAVKTEASETTDATTDAEPGANAENATETSGNATTGTPKNTGKKGGKANA